MVGLLASVFLLYSQSIQQGNDIGAIVFAKVSDAVVFLIVQDEKGNPLGQGSGFVFGDGLIVTNAHVAGAGKVFIKAGGFNIPCGLEKLDSTHDLAILRPSAQLNVTPLVAATTTPPNGTTIFALGNPKGLERTISQGLVTGLRRVEGREMLQINAPISPGSSGGPVVLATGEVVGVATGSFSEGQNLNFAVPIGALQALLSPEKPTESLFDSLMEQLISLRASRRQLKVSLDENSPWQRSLNEESTLLMNAIQASQHSLDRLLRVARESEPAPTDVRVATAQAAYDAVKPPSPEATRLLALALQERGTYGEGSVRVSALKDAEALALRLDGPKVSVADLVLLAAIQGDQPDRQVMASKTAQRALVLNPSKSQQAQLYRILFAAARSQKAVKEGIAWFTKLVDTGQANDFDREALGMLFDEAEQYRESAAVYVTLAKKDDLFLLREKYTLWCDAAIESIKGGDDDGALDSARACVSAAAPEKGSEHRAAQAHRIISSILTDRSVFESALEHAREASKIEPDEYRNFYFVARALNGLERYSEAEAAAKRALALSDGKDSDVHFTLGSAYFSQKKWSQAKSAYETVARMDTKSAAAAYNVAVSLYNDGFYKEAIYWYEETLRRNPTINGYQEIRQTITTLKAK